MRQILLMLTIAIGSPLAMAQEVAGAANASVAAADTTQHAAAAAPEAPGKHAHKPVSAIGRALAELLQADQPAAKALQTRDGNRTAEAGISSAIGTAQRTELAAQTEPPSE